MLRTYKWRGVFWRFEDGKAPEGAKLVEVAAGPVTAEEPKKAPTKRTTRARKPKADTTE